MKRLKPLIREIERLRVRLNYMFEQKGASDSGVITLSTDLDKLLNAYTKACRDTSKTVPKDY